MVKKQPTFWQRKSQPIQNNVRLQRETVSKALQQNSFLSNLGNTFFHIPPCLKDGKNPVNCWTKQNCLQIPADYRNALMQPTGRTLLNYDYPKKNQPSRTCSALLAKYQYRQPHFSNLKYVCNCLTGVFLHTFLHLLFTNVANHWITSTWCTYA